MIFHSKRLAYLVPLSAIVVVLGVFLFYKYAQAPGRVEVAEESFQVFGNQATGDLNGDGLTDSAVIVYRQPGGSGTFYYVIAKVSVGGGVLKETNAVLLGDRIAPQTTEIRNGVLIVNYAERRPGEPMTAQPSVGASKYLEVQGLQLVETAP